MPKNLRSMIAQRAFDEKIQKVRENKDLMSTSELANAKAELEHYLDIIKREEQR